MKLTISKTQDYDSDRRNISCVGRMASIIAAKHDMDLIVADAANGETSIITYQNDSVTSTKDTRNGELIS